MATLTLKKKHRTSAPIVSKPYADLVGHFAVMRQSHRSRSMRFTSTHEQIADAKIEAIRLQLEHPTTRYLIMQVVDYVGV